MTRSSGALMSPANRKPLSRPKLLVAGFSLGINIF
jgi:hypothetical protein